MLENLDVSASRHDLWVCTYRALPLLLCTQRMSPAHGTLQILEAVDNSMTRGALLKAFLR